jgi:hypothetical protein
LKAGSAQCVTVGIAAYDQRKRIILASVWRSPFQRARIFYTRRQPVVNPYPLLDRRE